MLTDNLIYKLENFTTALHLIDSDHSLNSSAYRNTMLPHKHNFQKLRRKVLVFWKYCGITQNDNLGIWITEHML